MPGQSRENKIESKQSVSREVLVCTERKSPARDFFIANQKSLFFLFSPRALSRDQLLTRGGVLTCRSRVRCKVYHNSSKLIANSRLVARGCSDVYVQ